MALRYAIPHFNLESVNRESEPERPVKAAKPPVPTGFRSGADLSGVVESVRSSRSVLIDAAVGSGKSVLVPLELARCLGKPVIHTVPGRILAYAISEYVATQTTQDVTYVEGVDTVMPTRGVIFISNSDLIARMLHDLAAFKVKYVLYMDEIHESDAATAVLRTLGPTMSLVEHFVSATATSNPAGFRKRETKGAIRMATYMPIALEEWDVSKPGMPWCATEFDGGTLVFMDNAKVAENLRQQYLEYGLDVFVLTSRSTNQEYINAKAALQDAQGSLTVLIVDSSFRSGITLPGITRIVDSGWVRYITVNEANKPIWAYRRAYAFEMEQAAGRGGRIAGSSAICYQPNVKFETKMVDLEGVEADAAALLFRLFGFKPPHHLRNSPLAAGSVPIDIATALNDKLPLRCIPADKMCPWENPKPLLPPVLETVTPQFHRPRRTISPPCSPRVTNPRSPTPPPSVVPQYAQEEVHGLDQYDYEDYKRRSTSPVAASLFTLDDGADVPEDGQLTEERYELLRASTLRSHGKKRDSVTPVMPAMPSQFASSHGAVPVAGESFTRPMPGRARSPEPGFDGSVRNKSRHKRDLSSVSSGPDFEEQFADIMSTMDLAGTTVELGQHYYYPGVEKAPSRCVRFPRGLESVLGFLSGRETQDHINTLPREDRMFAVAVLLDAYNEETITIRAIQRMTTAMSEVAADVTKVVERTALRDWMVGIAEVLSSANAAATAYAGAMVRVARNDFVKIAPLEERERAVMEHYMQELHSIVTPVDDDAPGHYARALTDRRALPPENKMLLNHRPHSYGGRGSQKVLPPVPYDRHLDRGVSRSMVPSHRRDGYDDDDDVVRVRYKFAPDRGARGVFARPFMKLLGEGEVVLTKQ